MGAPEVESQDRTAQNCQSKGTLEDQVATVTVWKQTSLQWGMGTCVIEEGCPAQTVELA